jgi:hypothetical protein
LTKVLEHPGDLGLGRLIHVPCSRRIGEADRTPQVAAVCDVNDREPRVASMLWTDATVIRAAFTRLGARVSETFTVFSILVSSRVLLIVTPVQFSVFAMLSTGLLDVDFIVLFVDCSLKDLEAFGTDALGVLDELQCVSPL